MNDLTVIIPTYNRGIILKRTIELLEENLIYDLGNVYYLIGDDGNDDSADAVRGMERVKVIEGPRNGLGANLNMLINRSGTDLLMQLDDDHHLVKQIDINEHAWHIINEKDFGWIRLMYGRCTGVEGYYKFTAQLYGKYWRLLPNTTELYLPSNRPHIKSKKFHTQHYGYYTPGVRLGETEVNFCKYFSQKYIFGQTPDIFIPMYPPAEDSWDHVGESWQHTEHDKGR